MNDSLVPLALCLSYNAITLSAFESRPEPAVQGRLPVGSLVFELDLYGVQNCRKYIAVIPKSSLRLPEGTVDIEGGLQVSLVYEYHLAPCPMLATFLP